MANPSEQIRNPSDESSPLQDSSMSIHSGLPIQGQACARLINPLDDLQPCSSNMSLQTPLGLSNILTLPKAPPRKNTGSKKTKPGSTRILINTSVRNEIEKEKQQRQKRNKKPKESY